MYRQPSSATASRGRGGVRAPSAGPSSGQQRAPMQPTGGPSMAQIQASYAALMEDDDYVPPTAMPSHNSRPTQPRGGLQQRAPSAGGRGRGAGAGAPSSAAPRRPSGTSSTPAGGFHFQQNQSNSAEYDHGGYKLDTLVRRGSGSGAPTNTASNGRRGSGNASSGSGGLTQWSLPVDASKGGNTLGIGGSGLGGGGGGVHNGFFYSDNQEFNSDDDDVNNNALYYGDEQLRTGVTKKGSVAMSPGRIRRTPQGSSTETSPTNVQGMGRARGITGGGGGLSSSHGRGVGSSQPPPPTDSYRQSVASAPSSARGRGGQQQYSTVDVLNNEHTMSNRGRQVREDVDNMMDAYYGNGGVNEYNNLGVMGNMVSGGRGAASLKNNQQNVHSDDDSYTQQIDVRTSGVGRGGSSAKSLENCMTAGDGPMAKPQNALLRMNPQWQRGPKQEEGRIFDASDRNLLCMDVRGDQAVVGSADHGLKVFDIKTMRERRNLYGKKCGHTEWVTSVVYLADGRILSGGMDSKLCLWHASALKCDDLLGHTGSISQVDASPQNIAVSASYDRTLRVWNCASARPSCVASLVGHGQPVMSFAWAGSMVMSGDRRGTVKVWDLNTSACAATYETKGGQIGSLGHLLHPEMGHISCVGDQKGTVSIFDFRRSGANPIFSESLHPGGVVSSIKGMPLSGSGGGLIVTAGADRKIKVLDPRMSFRPIHTMADHKDFIYSMETFGDLVISGGGNGWLLVHDTKTGKCLYGLGANAAAVRCIFPTNEYLVAAGDDGKAMVYDY